MAHNENRVPQNDPEFDQYIRNTADYLVATDAAGIANFTRLGLTTPEKNGWVQRKTEWVAVYPLYTNLNTRTKTITGQKNDIKKDFTVYAAPLLTRISVSPAIIEADRNALNLPVPDREPTPRGKIEVAPDVNITSLAGGFMKIRCRIDEDANRASMHPLADAIEMRYLIGTEAPATEEDCPSNLVSKKALFNFEAGTGNGGKRLFIFCRYANYTTPANSGPWTTVHSGTIQA